MKLACIIGWPLEHTLSPAIHNAAFEALGLDWTYLAVPVPPGEEGAGTPRLRALGVQGANVTIPHKETIIGSLDGLDGDAERFGAVNTVARDGERLIGHNTDGAGFLAFLTEDAGIDVAGRRVTVLGAGGAARAVAGSLVRAGAEVTVCARRPQQAEALASLDRRIATAPMGGPHRTDVLVSAVPALERDVVASIDAGVVVDLVYGGESELLRAARARAIPAFDGLGMLVRQAALSFELWTGRPAPLGVMHQAGAHGLFSR